MALPFVAVAGLAVALVVSLAQLWGVSDSLYDGVIRVDGYALFFKTFFIALGGVVILVSVDFVRRNLEHPGEYYGILLFTVVAMMLLAASGELLTAYISLELLSSGCMCWLLRPLQPKVQRGRDEIHPAGRVLVRAAAIRHEPDIRVAGNDALRRD